MAKPSRHTGTIKTMHPEKGFGFITMDGRRDELFFHRSAVRSGVWEELRAGQRVSFDVQESTKGPRAEMVDLVD